MTLLSEARWTPPRADCPHPEWWTSADDESTEIEVSQLVAGFVRALQPELVVETGTAFGQTAEQIGMALNDNRHGRLQTMEIDDQRLALARTRVVGLPVDVLRTYSLLYTPPAPIDFAWIDSLLGLRAQELEHLHPWLKPGAIVGVHDAGPQHGIREAIEAIDWIRWMYLRTPRGVLFGEVLR